MKKAILLCSVCAMLAMTARAGSKQTVTIQGTAVGKNATHITFTGDQVTLSLSDGTSQTADLNKVTIAFEHTAVFKDTEYNNVETIKTYGGKTLKAEVTRTLKKGEWATLCLPFDMSASDISNAFGTGTQVAALESTSSDAIHFASVDKMNAGMPYIILPAKDVTSFTIDAVEIAPLATACQVEGEMFGFTGTLNAMTPNSDNYYLATGNKLNHLLSGSILPLRAFFTNLEAADADCGDANGDGHVNVADVMATANHVIGCEPALFQFAKADVNNDKAVNVTDVMAIVKIILNGGKVTKTDVTITVDGEAIAVTSSDDGNGSDQASNPSIFEQ